MCVCVCVCVSVFIVCDLSLDIDTTIEEVERVKIHFEMAQTDDESLLEQ